jgi:hypothetical protein
MTANRCRSAELLLMSFEGMGKSIRLTRAPSPMLDAQPIIRMSFPASYSSAGCSPAEPASASPADAKYAAQLAQLRARFNGETMNRIALKLGPV